MAGNSSYKAGLEEKEKEEDNGVTAAAVAVGAVVGVASLAAWGISKWFGGSDSTEPEKMMKAPGRDYYMPRKEFEASPKDYFRGSRGKK